MIQPKMNITRHVSRQMRNQNDLKISQSLGEFAIVTVVVAATSTISLCFGAQIALKRLIDSFKNL